MMQHIVLLLLFTYCTSFKFKSSEQTSFENSKVNRVVAGSRWRETLRREKLEIREKLKQRKRRNEQNKERFLSFNQLCFPDHQAIVSLFIRRRSFVKLRPKSKNPVLTESSRYSTIHNEWFHFRDILVEGNPVTSLLSSLKNEGNGISEEKVREQFEQFLCSEVSALNNTRPFTPLDAYQELIGFDPSIATMLPPRNLELGYALKVKPPPGATLDDQLKLLEAPINPLIRAPSPEKRLIMDLGKMEDVTFSPNRVETLNSISRRKELSAVLNAFLNRLLLSNTSSIVVGIDGSATYHDLERQKNLCASAGLILLPFPVTYTSVNPLSARIGSEAVLCSIRPITGRLENVFEAELLSAASAISLVLTLLRLLPQKLMGSDVQKSITFDLEIVSDSKAIIKLLRDYFQGKVTDYSFSSDYPTCDVFKASLQAHLLELGELIESLKDLKASVSLSFQWNRGHPELRDPNPIR